MVDYSSSCRSSFGYAGIGERDLNNILDVIDKKGVSSSPAFQNLVASVKQGNSEGIEIMQQIALRNDEVGSKAEALLFDLFSGKEAAKTGVAEDILQQSLRLFETGSPATREMHSMKRADGSARDSVFFNGNDRDASLSKLSSPTKLLYMAGAAAVSSRAHSHLKTISDVFRNSAATRDLFPAGGNDAEFWSAGRLMVDAELMTALNILGDSAQVFIGTPLAAAELPDMFRCALEQNPDCNSYYFPIEARNHFVTFGVYIDKNNQYKALFFSSLPTYYSGNPEIEREGVQNHIIEAASVLGIPPENITVIEPDLQQNAPNACGLFTLKALELVLEKRGDKTPVERLNAFSQKFLAMDASEQRDININGRRQLHGAMITAAQNSYRGLGDRGPRDGPSAGAGGSSSK